MEWPLGSTGLTNAGASTPGGLFEGATKLMVGGMVQREKQQEKETDAAAKRAQQEATLAKSTAEGVWDRGMKIWEDPNMPSAVKVSTFNTTMRGAMSGIGHAFPELPAGFEVGADDVKVMKNLNAVIRDPNASYDEKLDNISVLTAHLSTNPKYAPMIKGALDRVAEARNSAVDQVATMTHKILTKQATPEEEQLFAAQKAIASRIPDANDPPWIAKPNQDRATIFAEGMRKGAGLRDAEIEARNKTVLKLGEKDRAVQMNQDGTAREVVPAAPSAENMTPSRAAAGTFAQLLSANPGMSEEAAAIQAWRQHGDLPDSMKTLVPSIVQAEIAKDVKKETALLPGKVEVARQTGAVAAATPARTPEAELKRWQEMAVGRAQIGEMHRLADKVDLPNLIGALRPYVNGVIQTGKAGPIPIPADLLGKLTPEQDRFLALTSDYADSVLRMRSGAAITESEFKRMLGFLTSDTVRPETFRTRLTLQDDLLQARQDVLHRSLESGGYRAPKPETPSLNRGGGGATSTGLPAPAPAKGWTIKQVK